MVSPQRKIGNIGEEVACKCLKKQNYKILERNFLRKAKKSPFLAEIDVIANHKGIIHFIEVKTAAGQANNFLPEQRVNYKKQQKLTKASQSWLMKNKIPLNTKWQIDIMAVNLDFNSRKAQIKHFKNAIY